MNKDAIKPLMWTVTVLAFVGMTHAADQSGVTEPIVTVKPVVVDQVEALPPGAVRLNGFIQERLQQQADYLFDEKTLAAMVEVFRNKPHRLKNGKGVTGLAEGEFWGKAVRALCHQYQYSGDPRLRQLLEKTVADVLTVQTPDGCLSDTEPALQPYHSDMWDRKYTLLGLVDAFETTGDTKIRESALKMARHTIGQVGPPPKVRIVDTSYLSSPQRPGGIFFGLESSSILEPVVRLYRLTGNAELLEFAKYIVETEGCSKRGSIFEAILSGKDAQELGGRLAHAYSVTSCFEGLVEYYRVTGNERWKQAALAFYSNVLAKETAIIGTFCGLGPLKGPVSHEQFNHSGLHQASPVCEGLEACSATRWMAYCRHLHAVTGEPAFIDEYERSFYNALLGSIRPDGKAVDYFTRLNGSRPVLKGNFRRAFNGKSFTCCTYNVADSLALIPFTTVMSGMGGPVVNLYIPGTARLKLPEGNEVVLEQTTDYPKTGEIAIAVRPLKPARFPIRLRIPQWSSQTRVRVNGQAQEAKPGSYLVLERNWAAGDTVTLSLDMRGRLIRPPEGTPATAEAFRALMRGPIVLARDKRLGGNIHEGVDIQADAEGYVKLSPMPATIAARMQFVVPTVDGGNFPVIDFESSGNTWDEASERVTWIPVAGAPIDRQALVKRHNLSFETYDPANPLQTGNGEFAFAVDATGLQTFTDQLGTFSQWGWHTFPNPEGYRVEETLGEVVGGGGRKALYPYGVHGSSKLTPEQKARATGAFNWYRRSPHRLHLGRIGFELNKADGKVARQSDLKKIRQTLDLWSGVIHSSFEFDGVPVEVTTCCHPQQDAVAVQVKSPLLTTGRIKVFWRFPYPGETDCKPTWKAELDGRHQSEAVLRDPGRVDILRTLDADRYSVSVAWTKGEWQASGPHRFVLTPSRDAEQFSFVSGFGQQAVGDLPRFAESVAASTEHWRKFWLSGGAIDLSASKDPRWHELERRIVLSQYLTAVNSAGSAPPQESGLFSNGWYGKFHLEMTAWHGMHFMLWGRAALLDGWMKWMLGPGLESARLKAAQQDYRGARWMKMIAPEAKWETPCGFAPFRMTQQGHAIYWAEQQYRERPTRETLERFKDMVMESAEFMADYVWWDGKSGRYVLGPPLLTGSEATPWSVTFNSTVELSYWFYGLRTAQQWRERLGLARDPKWDAILAKLSKPPVANGLYVDAEPFPAYKKDRHCRPAWLEAFGCMRGDEIERVAMGRTFETIWGDIRAGVPWQIWGCDFPMLAMTAARLGRPQDAVDALLLDHAGNKYLPNGFNNGGIGMVPIYLPAHGGLLWAVAMMAAGWDGAPARHAPGFPDNGQWTVKWEGLKRAQ